MSWVLSAAAAAAAAGGGRHMTPSSPHNNKHPIAGAALARALDHQPLFTQHNDVTALNGAADDEEDNERGWEKNKHSASVSVCVCVCVCVCVIQCVFPLHIGVKMITPIYVCSKHVPQGVCVCVCLRIRVHMGAHVHTGVGGLGPGRLTREAQFVRL